MLSPSQNVGSPCISALRFSISDTTIDFVFLHPVFKSSAVSVYVPDINIVRFTNLVPSFQVILVLARTFASKIILPPSQSIVPLGASTSSVGNGLTLITMLVLLVHSPFVTVAE